MVTPEIEIYVFYRYGLSFYGYYDIYDYDSSDYYYYDDTTGEKVHTETEGWHYFLDKDNVHYLTEEELYSMFTIQPIVKVKVGFTADIDPSQNEYDLNWDYDPSEWYESDEKYYLYADIQVNVGSNGRWMFNYPNDWKIKSLYEFHTESDEGGSGSGGSEVEPNIASVDFKSADDLSEVNTTEYMFSGCSRLTTVDFSRSDLSNVTNADYMFNDCRSLSGDSVVINSDETFAHLESAYSMFFCTGDDNYDNFIEHKTGYVGETVVTKILGLQNNGTFNTPIEYVYLKFVKNNIKYKIDENSTVFILPNNYTGNITIPNTVTESNTTFDIVGMVDYAFAECSGLNTVSFSNNSLITVLPFCAFYDSGITSITLPPNLTTLMDSVFSGCTSLTGALTIPSTVTSVGNYTFRGCEFSSVTTNSNADFSSSELKFTNNNVKYLVVSKSTASFCECDTSTTGSVTIPSSITKGNTFSVVSIYYNAFNECSLITSVTIPNTVTSIGSSAFYRCTGLTSLTIPSGVTTIGSYAFNSCTSMTTIVIPSTVTSVQNSAFSNCTALTSVTINSDVNLSSAALYITSNGIRYKINSRNAAQVVTKSTAYTGDVVIPTTLVAGSSFPVTSIANNVFTSTSITSISIGDSVTSIGNDAFSSCLQMTSVTIGSGVTTIGTDAFYNCKALPSIVIPNGVTTIGSYAFGHCNNIISVTLPSSVTTIGAHAFEDVGLDATTVGEKKVTFGNVNDLFTIDFQDDHANPLRYLHKLYVGGTEITSVTIPSGVTTISQRMLRGCTSITSLTIPSGVTTIGAYAFYGCGSLTIITIPNTVTTIGNYAFAYSHLTKTDGREFLIIPNSVTSIGEYAFSRDSGLVDIRLSTAMTTLKSNTFEYCSSLLYVKINDGMTTINGYAFCDCTAMTSIRIANTVSSINTKAFTGCSALTTIYYSGSSSGFPWGATNATLQPNTQ